MSNLSRLSYAVGAIAVAGVAGLHLLGHADARAATKTSLIDSPAPAAREQTLLQYCSGCHNDKLKTGGMSVQGLHADNLMADDGVWENILHKLSVGEMPPKGRPRPSPEQIADFTQWLSTSLDKQAALHPNPGHMGLRRMNRAEYANAVRDLLGVDVDVSTELPVDDTGYGFDNIADVDEPIHSRRRPNQQPGDRPGVPQSSRDRLQDPQGHVHGPLRRAGLQRTGER